MPTFIVLEINDPVLAPFVANFTSMLGPGVRELCRAQSLGDLVTRVRDAEWLYYERLRAADEAPTLPEIVIPVYLDEHGATRPCVVAETKPG